MGGGWAKERLSECIKEEEGTHRGLNDEDEVVYGYRE